MHDCGREGENTRSILWGIKTSKGESDDFEEWSKRGKLSN